MVTSDRMVTTPTGRGGTRACGLVANALATLFALAAPAANAAPRPPTLPARRGGG